MGVRTGASPRMKMAEVTGNMAMTVLTRAPGLIKILTVFTCPKDGEMNLPQGKKDLEAPVGLKEDRTRDCI